MAKPRPCPICQSGHDEPFYEYRYHGLHVTVVICTACGLARNEPMPMPDELLAAQHGSLTKLHRPKYSRIESLKRARRYLNGIRPYAKQGGSLLDVGCGDGTFLEVASRSGLRCTGIDIDADSCRLSARRSGVPVVTGSIDDLDPDTQRFDAITASHVLEHLEYPVRFLQSASRLLSPGGVLQLEVPNILRPKTSFRRFFCIQHAYYFCPDTLLALLARNGFRPLSLTCFLRDSFQVVATPGECEDDSLRRGADWRKVLAAVQKHRWAYKATGQFAWRKVPWLKDAMYRVAWRRDFSGTKGT